MATNILRKTIPSQLTSKITEPAAVTTTYFNEDIVPSFEPAIPQEESTSEPVLSVTQVARVTSSDTTTAPYRGYDVTELAIASDWPWIYSLNECLGGLMPGGTITKDGWVYSIEPDGTLKPIAQDY